MTWRCPACGVMLSASCLLFTRAYCGCTIPATGRGTEMLPVLTEVYDCGSFRVWLGPWQ